MDFPSRLRHLRKQSHLMQMDIAAKIGVSVRTFQSYEQGIIEPNIEKLIMLAAIFDVTLDQLISPDSPLPGVDVGEH